MKRTPMGPDSRPWPWRPPWHRPREWNPPELALRKFARRQSNPETQAFHPLYAAAQDNWVRVSTLVLDDALLLGELSVEDADEVVFVITCDAFIGWDEWTEKAIGLWQDFIDAVGLLYQSGRCFSPDGFAEYMAWDNIAFGIDWTGGGVDSDERKQQLRDHLFAAISTTLALERPGAQQGALNGFDHLGDAMCVPIVEELRRVTTDEEVRNLCDVVLARDMR